MSPSTLLTVMHGPSAPNDETTARDERGPSAPVDLALPGHRQRALEGEAPQALREWSTLSPPRSAALDEETARAEVYGLLAQLWYAPPTPELLQGLRSAATEAPAPGAYLEASWQQLIGKTRALSPAAIQAEFQTLFEGVGKPDIYLFGSHYLSGFLNDKPLARLRHDLHALGLDREAAMTETEDHIAYLCEVMRYLIAGDDPALCNLTQQQAFFQHHLQAWWPALCQSVAQHPSAHWYAALADFSAAFGEVEVQGFDMLD